MTELQEKILELKKRGLSLNEIVSEVNTTKGVVDYVLSPLFAERVKKKEMRKKAEEEFVELVKTYLPVSNSLNHLCSNLGLRGVEGYYKKLKRIIEENNLSTEHFGTLRVEKQSRNQYTAMSDEEFFVNGCGREGKAIIKRLVEGKYKEYKCEHCGISEWDGKPLRLQVHHINGDHNDNRLENLQLLCPNCHTQTDTYARNNVIKKKGFKIINRVNEIMNNTESSFKPKDLKEIKMRVLPPKEKRYCEFCGKEIIGDGERYCSHECAEKANRKFEVDPDQLIEDFREIKSFRGVGKKYGVTDNAIRRRVKKLGVYDKIEQYITHR